MSKTLRTFIIKDVIIDGKFWTDSYDFPCRLYEGANWCSKEGFGADWEPFWGSFSDFSSKGHTAGTACCACGGGNKARFMIKINLIKSKNLTEK